QKDNIVRIEEISKEEARNIFQWKYHKITEEVITILETPQDAYQKKIALFNFLKDLEKCG
ncbi:7537_t:CDS:1, partial [Ambispora gerdemannii]